MKTLSLLSFIFILFYSCDRKVNINQQKLIGDWVLVKKEYIPDDHRNEEDFKPFTLSPFLWSGGSYYSNGECDNFPGYYRRENLEYGFAVKYEGRRTIYKVEGNDLTIFNPVDSIWGRFILTFPAKDSMRINTGYVEYSFARKDYSRIAKLDFDQIILYGSSCYGHCEKAFSSIQRDGKFLFFGKNNVTKKGWYKAKLSPKVFQSIAKDFNKCELVNVPDTTDLVYDVQYFDVIFLKKRKTVKTIRKYGWYGPEELGWAITNFQFLYKQLPTVPDSTKEVPSGVSEFRDLSSKINL